MRAILAPPGIVRGARNLYFSEHGRFHSKRVQVLSKLGDGSPAGIFKWQQRDLNLHWASFASAFTFVSYDATGE